MRHFIGSFFCRGASQSKRLHDETRSILRLCSYNRAPLCRPSPCPPLLQYDKELVRFLTTTPPNDETGSASPRKTSITTSSSQSSLDDEASPSESKDQSTSTSGIMENQSLSLPFPWRINAVEPLPRVVENDDYSGMELTPWARFVRKAFVALELNTSWFDIIFWKKWEQEIVQSCAFAFQRAVCGLLSQSFQVPIKDITDFDDFNCKSLSINTMPDSTKTHLTMTDEDKAFTDQYVAGILDTNLLHLYKCIASKVHIDFSLTLIQVRLENAFMIPHLTRSDVYTDSSLQGAYTKIERKWKETRDTDAIIDMGRDLQVKTKHHGTKRSLLIDVSIICLEKFRLRDKDSGKILTGDDTPMAEGQIVTHLVRFEMETDKAKNGMDSETQRELGHWKIVDIDDMLKGNVWY